MKKSKADREGEKWRSDTILSWRNFLVLLLFLRKNEFLKRMPVSSQKGSRQA
jgi:hypothetical protein